MSDLKTTPQKESLLYLFENLLESTKTFITSKDIRKENNRSKLKSITMLMDDLWTEKYRKKMVRFYEKNTINLHNDSVTFILLGGRKSQKRIEQVRKMRKLKEKLEKRGNLSQSSGSKNHQIKSRKLSESIKQKAFGGKDGFNEAEIRKVFPNLDQSFVCD